MKIIEPSYEILRPCALDAVSRKDALLAIAGAARTCYKSRGTYDSALVAQITRNGHEAMIEHYSATVRFIIDRGVSHEIVRHRVASYAQESTRYCSYNKAKFGSEITVIRPSEFEPGTANYEIWAQACQACEKAYFALLENGAAPEFARDVLPTSLKTEIIVTMNLREWRHFFRLRAAGTTGRPHPQMRQVAQPLLEEMRRFLPEIFGDI